MSRSGLTGQLGMKPQPRRSAAEELLRMQANSQPITQPSPQWPPQHAEHGQRAPQQAYGQQPFHFPQPIGEADGAHGYAQHAPVQPLPFPPQASGQPPFNRYPQPAPDPDPNYGYAQQG